jgi:hypothetical protein
MLFPRLFPEKNITDFMCGKIIEKIALLKIFLLLRKEMYRKEKDK